MNSKGSAQEVINLIFEFRVLRFDDAENGPQKPAVASHRLPITRDESALDFILRRWADQLHPSNEDPQGLRGDRIDGERQNRVYVGDRKDVDEAAAFFKPRISPGLQHGVSLIAIKAASYQHLFQFEGEGVNA